jgi:hypothetical protein
VDYNADKYLVEDSDLLTEAEKIQMATSLRELELKGVIEWRDGAWQLAANVESEETCGTTDEGPWRLIADGDGWMFKPGPQVAPCALRRSDDRAARGEGKSAKTKKGKKQR